MLAQSQFVVRRSSSADLKTHFEFLNICLSAGTIRSIPFRCLNGGDYATQNVGDSEIFLWVPRALFPFTLHGSAILCLVGHVCRMHTKYDEIITFAPAKFNANNGRERTAKSDTKKKYTKFVTHSANTKTVCGRNCRSSSLPSFLPIS